MEIIATETKAKNLKPGDLFSTANQLYWDNIENHNSIGEKVYIRTDKLCPEEENEIKIYKIAILKKEN